MDWVKAGEPEVHRQRSKWVVRQAGYDPATGKRRIRQFGTYETKRAALARRKELADGRAGSDTELLKDFLEGVWLPSKQGRVETNTLDQYDWAVRLHIVPLLGAVRLCDLTPELIDGWVTTLNAPDEAGKRRLGATSTRLVRKVLSMALQEAVERGRIPRNPVLLSQPPRRARPTQKLGWTIDEARQFLASVSDHRLAAAFHICLVTGLRRGEVLGLRWEDVDLDACQLQVQQQLTTVRGKPTLKSLKTEASERAIAFGPSTAAVLVRHSEAQTLEAAFAGDGWTQSGLVFTNPVGRRLDPNSFRRLMDSLVDQAGVSRITPKGLRHTAQSVGRVVVGDDKVMQERLGHADIGVTLNTYTHTVSAQHREAGLRIDEVFRSAPPEG